MVVRESLAHYAGRDRHRVRSEAYRWKQPCIRTKAGDFPPTALRLRRTRAEPRSDARARALSPSRHGHYRSTPPPSGAGHGPFGTIRGALCPPPWPSTGSSMLMRGLVDPRRSTRADTPFCIADRRRCRTASRVGTDCAERKRDAMEVLPDHPTTKGPAERFTGEVWIDVVAQGHGGPPMVIAFVRLTPGARAAGIRTHSARRFMSQRVKDESSPGPGASTSPSPNSLDHRPTIKRRCASDPCG